MNRTIRSGSARGLARNQGYLPSPQLGRWPGLSGERVGLGRLMPVWLWLAVLVAAVALYGCGGGDGTDEEPAPSDEEAASDSGYPPSGTQRKPRQAKEPQVAEEKEAPLPEDFAQWQEDHYYQAKRQWDPRLVEAVAYLGEQSAGTQNADGAAQILTKLLEKSEEPEPKQRPGRGSSSGYPGYEEDEDENGDEDDDDSGYYDDDETHYDEDDEDYEEDYPGYYPSGYGRTAQARGQAVELIRAIVQALGVNGSNTAWQTIRQVVEGEFETDNNPVATIASLEMLVAHLSTENEALLLRCLTSPQELRELGGPGSVRRPGRSGYDRGYDRSGYDRGYEDEYPSGYPSGGRRTSGDRLTAEQLQQEAFSLIAPVASEQLRVKLAQHLAKPNTVKEDHELFGDYLRELHPDNLAAQMVLYLAQGMGAETKATIEENFLTYSSDALAGVLGIPVDKTRRGRPSRRRPERRGYEEDYPGYEDEDGYDEDDEGGYDYDDEDEYDEDDEGYAPSDDYPYRRSERPASGGPPSRYDRPEAGGPRRPSRYDTGQPKTGPHRPGAQRAPWAEKLDPDLPYRLARRLWASEFTGPLANRLNQAQSLDGDAQMLLLASTMPVDSMRSTLANVLTAHWQEGPRALEQAGLLDEVISDPGFLAVVKTLRRNEPKQETTPGRVMPGRRLPGRTPSRRPPGYRGYEDDGGYERSEDEDDAYEGYPGYPGRERPDRPGAKARTSDDPGVAWRFASEDLLRVLCERFLAAARSQARAAGFVGQPAAGQETHGLPFELRDDVTVVAEYHVDWPGTVQEKLAGVPLSEMKLHYVRAELHTRLSPLETYFNRQLGSPEIRQLEDGSWLDSFEPGPETGWKRSIDVMLTTTATPEERADRRNEIPVTVDVLCIDVKDPSPASAGN